MDWSFSKVKGKQSSFIFNPSAIFADFFLQSFHQISNFVMELHGHGMYEFRSIWMKDFQSVITGISNSLNSNLVEKNENKTMNNCSKMCKISASTALEKTEWVPF